jgi:hypothetical protein
MQASGTKTETGGKAVLATGPVRFGIGQITNPTPQLAKNIFRVVLYAAAIVNIVMLNIPSIPEETKVQIMGYSSMATVIVHAISKLFGIDISDIEPPKPTV